MTFRPENSIDEFERNGYQKVGEIPNLYRPGVTEYMMAKDQKKRLSLTMKPKDLSKMTLEELWELFPIFLVAHDDRWEESFDEVEKMLIGLLADQPVVRISHIGSTAIQGIWAKNIIDVMVEISQSVSIKDMVQILKQDGFIIMSTAKNRISLNKGYTENGFADKVYHIHLRYTGDNDELYFRDYLNEHPDVAKEYETLKLRLWKQYEHNRDAYTNAKTDFISKWTAEARKEYGDRY
uniref:Dephospho-CoA kinase/protein folding accessory domain-containing protein n=1 Tax=Eubacterium cellulosolvens (strain ATCC 43171 / JCM 9499 / 6) TaxID=633697 RepID=I5AW69_EUBC6